MPSKETASVGYRVEIRGITPLLMHYDNLDWKDDLETWLKDKRNRDMTKPGDDRTPAFAWIGSLYHDGVRVAFPFDVFLASLQNASTKVTHKGKATLKQFVQAGLSIDQEFIPLLVDGKEVLMEKILATKSDLNFYNHRALAEALGFSLYSRRAQVGNAKHVRVRPRFDRWACAFSITVTDLAVFKPETLADLLNVAGRGGVGDWRPSSPKKPGMFGQFSASIEAMK